MSKCEEVTGLALDEKSKDALERIRKKISTGNLLAGALSLGAFYDLFPVGKHGGVTSPINITQKQWELYTEAMKAIPAITRNAIRKEIDFMIFHYQFGNQHKHLKFWEGMKNGCNPF